MRKALEVGDLVEITMLGSEFCGARGLIADRIHYGVREDEDYSHPDEYSCAIWVVDSGFGGSMAMVRAKWLKLISKAEKST